MMTKISRRDFLRGVAAASGAALLPGQVGNAWGGPGPYTSVSLPPPDQSGIKHVVVVMMENRSFDHLLGWLPNADGVQEGLTYVDREGVARATRYWGPDYTGCGHPDPDHSYAGGRAQYNGGAMDGFLRSGRNDEYAIGYYGETDRPFQAALARNYTTLDRYFCSILGPTFPNRFFMHSAQTDRLSNTLTQATLPTIWDRLADAGVSARYYFSNLPFLALWGQRYLSISHSYLRFLVDAATDRLPAVSFIDPWYTTRDDGFANDDHPHADIRRGDAFLAQTFHALANSPAWSRTVLIINYDEWGGFFDHVAPPRAVAPNEVDPDLEGGKALLGFRVPTIVASPFSRGDASDPRVNGRVFDHTSVLKLIEWRWGLAPLTARDASDDVANLAYALDFNNPRPERPDLPTPRAPHGDTCQPTATTGEVNGPDTKMEAEDASEGLLNDWDRLRHSELLDGWPLP